MEKFFTPKEANEALAEIKKIVGEILVKAQEVRVLITSVDALKHQDEVIGLQERIKALMAELEAMGCYYKDWNFEIGLVDFPAIIHGQEALLCWRSDEPKVEWFHGYEEGYMGRRKITPDLVFS